MNLHEGNAIIFNLKGLSACCVYVNGKCPLNSNITFPEKFSYFKLFYLNLFPNSKQLVYTNQEIPSQIKSICHTKSILYQNTKYQNNN